ncbi:MAG: hypothetical protein E6H47_14775 [Betaproteobacteria bacterium]|nr:MAG: hypothetical protein E6H47_14775 [Betaproteobacteria bacterium]
MNTRARIFRRTKAGNAAFEDRHSGLPAHYRRILCAIAAETHSVVLRAVLPCYSETQIVQWLAELLTLGLLESVPDGAEPDLDFTGRFQVAELAAAFNGRT